MNKNLNYKISSDSNGKPLDGSRNYRFQLLSDMPATNFWSVIVYDIQTQLIIQGGQAWPSVHSNSKKIVLNSDGTLNIWFGPTAPEGRENNWIQTVQGKEWQLVLRLYDLFEPLQDHTWSPGEIEEVK